MITVEVTIKDENGTVLASRSGDAMKPLQWKAKIDKPIVDIESRDEKNSTNIHWNLFGWTLQPMVTRELRRK